MREENETPSAYTKRSFDGVTDLEMLDEVDDQLRAEGLNPDNIRHPISPSAGRSF